MRIWCSARRSVRRGLVVACAVTKLAATREGDVKGWGVLLWTMNVSEVIDALRTDGRDLGELETLRDELSCASITPAFSIDGVEFRADACFSDGHLTRVRLTHDTEGVRPTPYTHAKAALIERYGRPVPTTGNPWTRSRTWERGSTVIELSELQLPEARVTEINWTVRLTAKSAPSYDASADRERYSSPSAPLNVPLTTPFR